jgi:nucleoside-diphosphate-sugar epimerase
MFANQGPALEPGSTILVTGVSGFAGSHVADQLLAAGYHVRGTTRDVVKNAWVPDMFAKYGREKFELVTVVDGTKPTAFDSVLKGYYLPCWTEHAFII